MTIGERLRCYVELTRLDRPIGALLLLWPTWWALWIAAAGIPDLKLFAIFSAGVLLMRSAGCAINDYWDRQYDPRVARTAFRPLARNAIEPAEALWVGVSLATVSFILVLFTNRLTIALAGVGALLAVTYPLFKRFTYLPQVCLGVAFGWGIPMAFAAQLGSIPRVAWVLFIANMFWIVAYDTLYAMADREDDLRIGVKSSAILFGSMDRAIVGVLQISALSTLALVGDLAELGDRFDLGLAAAAAIALYHQWLIRERDPQACFRAFLHNNWLGAAVFAGLALDFALGASR